MGYDLSMLMDDSANPLKAAGIDPNDAIKNPDAVMQTLQNRQYGAGMGNRLERPSTLASSVAAPPSPAAATVSSDPDLDAARTLAQRAQQMTDRNQQQWSDLTNQQKTLEAQRAKDATYIDPRGTSAATGQSYKPSTGRQVLRGILGGVEGLMKGGFRGAVLGGINPRNVGVPGYQDPNAQYGRDMARQQATVASDDQQLTNLKDQTKTQYDAGRNLGTDTTANARTFGDIFRGKKDAESAANAARQADIRQQHEDETEQHNRARETETDAQNSVRDRNATANEQRVTALVNELGSQARKNDREPAGGKSGKPIPAGTAAKIVGDKDKAIGAAQQNFRTGTDKAGNVYGFDDYINDWQGAQNDYEDKLESITGQPQEHLDIRSNVDKQGKWIGRSAPAQPNGDVPAAQAQTSPVSKKAKSGTVIGPAPAGSRDGRTGALPDGTKVVVKGGKLVAQ